MTQIELGAAKKSDEDVVRKWVVQLDDLIDPESLEIIKLSLRSELKQTQLDNITRSSDLYNALKNSKVYDDEHSILARIMYALMVLSHRRYGHNALRRLGKEQCQSPFKISSLPARVDHAKFSMCQCLATACVVLKPENNERFIKHFANQLEINRNTVKTPCEIFVKMLQSDKITSENYHDLIEEAMVKSHLSDEKIEEYQKRCENISKEMYNNAHFIYKLVIVLMLLYSFVWTEWYTAM